MPEAHRKTDTPKLTPSEDSLRTQLDLVDTRMRHHILRFWALPLTYVSVTFVAISSLADRASSGIAIAIPVALIMFGALILLASIASFEGTMRSIDDVVEIETSLGLRPTPKKKPLQFVPYFLMIFLGITIASLSI